MKLLCAWCALTVVASPGLGICPDRLVWQADPGSRLGVVVQSNDRVLVDINGDQAFIPASVQKLFTTAGALQALGADFRTRTVLTMTEGGELSLEGGGDPSFSSEGDLPKLVSQLEQGDRAVQNIRVVSAPWGNPYGEGWEWADLQEPYAPPIGGVVIDENILAWLLAPSFNENTLGRPLNFSWKHPERARGWVVQNFTRLGERDTLQIRVQGQTLTLRGTLPTPIDYASPVPNPATHFITLLRQELTKQQLDQLKPGQAVVFSPPLRDLVRITNKDSHNLYAEQILRIVGRHYSQAGEDYETKGREIITGQVNTPGFYLADGSGLSRRNQATPRQIVELLTRMQFNQDFRQSLPIGGKDGTLTNRLQNLDIQAKTGTLTGIATMAGYLTPPKHPPVVFAIMINHSLLPPHQLRDRIDAMVAQLNGLTPCEP